MDNPKGNCISLSDLNWDSKKLIGQGKFGCVYQTHWSTSNYDEDGEEELYTVAVKCPEGVTKATVLAERNIKAKLWHENIVNILGYAQLNHNQKVVLVFEYVSVYCVRNLYDYIRDRREEGGVTAETMMRMALDIARGIEYLHENEYIHGDLALRNCIIKMDGNVKVGDLGSYDDKHEDLYFSDSKTSARGSIPCPVRWMAPENLPFKYNKKSQLVRKQHTKSYEGDIWAFGVVLYELWTRGEDPFDGCDDDMNVCKQILDGHTVATWNPRIKIRSSMKRLMKSCWEWDWEDRPDFESVVDDLENLLGSDSGEKEDLDSSEYDDSDE